MKIEQINNTFIFRKYGKIQERWSLKTISVKIKHTVADKKPNTMLFYRQFFV